MHRQGKAALTDCKLILNLRDGLSVSEQSSATVSSCEIGDSQMDAIQARGASTLTVNGCRLLNSGGQGIRLVGDSTAQARGNTITGSGSFECPGYEEKGNSKWSREQRAWALAVTAILEERNDHRCDRLMGCQEPDEQERIDCAFRFLNGYEVATHKDLIETMESLRAEGQQSEWLELRGRLGRMTAAQRKALPAKLEPTSELRHRVLLQFAHGETLGDKGIKGFDLVRCMTLVRWGYTAKILTEEEAWMLIMPLAEETQETFSSWSQLGTSYLAGREFWSPGDKHQKKAHEVSDALLSSGGTWTRYEWRLDLKPKP